MVCIGLPGPFPIGLVNGDWPKLRNPKFELGDRGEVNIDGLLKNDPFSFDVRKVIDPHEVAFQIETQNESKNRIGQSLHGTESAIHRFSAHQPERRSTRNPESPTDHKEGELDSPS